MQQNRSARSLHCSWRLVKRIEGLTAVELLTMRQELVVPLPSCVGPHSEKTPASAKCGRSENTL